MKKHIPITLIVFRLILAPHPLTGIKQIIMKRNVLIIFLLLSIITHVQGQKDSLKNIEKLGHRFYLKTEVLNSLARLVFVKGTYDIDVQLTFRLNNHLHFVNTYGQTTFNLSEKIESSLRPKVYQITDQTGTAYHRTSSMIRYYPFNNFENFADYLFIEGGLFFMHYKGKTNSAVYDSTKMAYETKYLQELDFYRYGPQINIGISQYFERKEENDAYYEKSKFTFSPEIFVGIYYNQLYILKSQVTNYVGAFPDNPYTENKIQFSIRAKIGFGFL